MAYGSGSTTPLRSQGVVIEKPIAPLYEDMSIGDEEEYIPVITALPVSIAEGHPVNWRSWSIEKRWGKKKVVYKYYVVMHMWQKAYEESKQAKSVSTVVSLDFLETCQDILEAVELPTATYSVAV